MIKIVRNKLCLTMFNIVKYLICILLIVIISPSFYNHSNLFSQQINISRIEQMPNLPAPYAMRNWDEATIGYDSYVFDFNITGQYLPLIWWNNNTINYPHISFGLHTVVGTTSPLSAEAINVLPAVISASLVEIDKSDQDTYNWVLMCEEYFNKQNGANVYLNHPSGGNWDDWWYDVMPSAASRRICSTCSSAPSETCLNRAS